MTRVELGDVQETLLIPLYARAVESSKPGGLLHDPKALEIVASLDYDFRKFERKTSLVGACMRTLHFDQWVRDFLQAHPGGTVVELGVGLNTRYERLDTGSAQWYELDLPDAMTLRRQFFEETPNRRFIAASVTDSDWLESVAASPPPYCFCSEAMLIFLPEAEVRKVMHRLATRFPGSWLLLDSLSPLMLRQQHRLKALNRMRARFAWALPHPRAFERWGPYTLLESLTVGELLRRYKAHVPSDFRALSAIGRFFFPSLLELYRFNRLKLG